MSFSYPNAFDNCESLILLLNDARKRFKVGKIYMNMLRLYFESLNETI